MRLVGHQGAGATVAGGLGVATVFAAAVALPLATYTTGLALFGLAHVGSELRYVDHRFGRRLAGGVTAAILAPLAVAVLARIAALAGAIAPTTDIALELAAGALMGVAALAAIPPIMPRRRLLGAVAIAALVVGAVLAPLQTLLCLAVVHNVTPLAFLADAFDGARRRRALVLGGVLFLLVPLAIASGMPYELMGRLGLVHPEATLFDNGPLAANLGAYVPSALIESRWATHMFAGAVFAQWMHYAVVILVLPRLIGTDARLAPARPFAPWPGTRTFALLLAAAGLGLAACFALDFHVTRQLYGVAALVHSWLEIPIVLLFLAGTGCAVLQPALKASVKA